MNARPSSIGVKILPEAPGLRPIESIAAAAMRPWPSAPPNAAMPRPTPAAIAIQASRELLAATSDACAKAGLETTSAITLTVRPTNHFAKRAIRDPPLMFLVSDGHGDVDHRQDAENQGLNDGHQAAEQKKRHRHQKRHQREEREDHLVVGQDVAHQAQR